MVQSALFIYPAMTGFTDQYSLPNIFFPYWSVINRTYKCKLRPHRGILFSNTYTKLFQILLSSPSNRLFTFFYPTIKPFLSGKTKNSNNNIVLCENDSIVNDQQEVSKNVNEFFINVAKDIGDKSIKINKEHPSVMKISENNTINNELNFKHVSEEFVTKQINKLNVKKTTGHDGISPEILKMAQQEITNPITKLVNKSIDSSIFPADLKSTRVSPLYTKK